LIHLLISRSYQTNTCKELAMQLLKPLLALSNNIILLFIGILGIGFIIGFHELGHFLFGKLFKIKTPSFAVGFGPKIYQQKIGETNFSIGAIPLGGYVESDKESFESKPYWQKMLVLAGGISFNLIFAYIVFCLLFALGLPKTKFLYPINTSPIISSIAQPETLQDIPLRVGDKIIAINGQPIGNSSSKLFDHMEKIALKKEHLAKKIALEIETNNQKRTVEINAKPFITALFKRQINLQFASHKQQNFIEAIKSGVALTNKYITKTLSMFKLMLVKRDTTPLGGPILIISETVKGAGQGLKVFLLLLAIISVSLAVINLIPLPILDGGQALLYTVEAVIRRKLSDRTKEIIFMISWIFMFTVFILISARDIWRIIKAFIIKK